MPLIKLRRSVVLVDYENPGKRTGVPELPAGLDVQIKVFGILINDYLSFRVSE